MNYLGLVIAILVFVKFFLDLGSVISIRNVFAVLMCLQFLLSPFLVYNGLGEFQVYKMKVSEEAYFSYVTPALIAFLIGLYWKRKSAHFEYDEIESLKFWFLKNPQIPYVFIAVGFVFTFLHKIAPQAFGFIFYLVSNLKYVGYFLLFLSKEKIPRNITILVVSSIVVSSFANAMFHDLFIWSILFLSSLFFKVSFKGYQKLAILLALVLSATVIQSIKAPLRTRMWEEGAELSLDVLSESYQENISATGSFFSMENLAPQITRINQGWIVASIMDNVPQNVPFANGEVLSVYLEAALLPRFIAPNKLNSGDKEIFNKYSGHIITDNTSMGISSVGDAYINFGVQGGWIFMLVYGLIFNLVIRQFVKLSRIYPTAYVFSFLILFYVIRPDCELQTTLGHLVKSGIMLFILFRMFGKYFRIRSLEEELK